jgi:hypothetical protein
MRPRPLVGPRQMAAVLAITAALTLGRPALGRVGGPLAMVAWLAAARLPRGWLGATLLAAGAALMVFDPARAVPS